MTKFIVDWLECECECGGDVEVTSECGSSEQLYDGDECKCLGCGAKGVIECDDGAAWTSWETQ